MTKPHRRARRILLFLFLSALGLFSFLLVQKDLAEVSYNLGTICFESEHFYEALCALKTARWMKPENPKVLLSLGNVYCRMGSYGLAEEAYREALGRNPQHVEPQHRLALLYLQTGKFDLATEFLRKAIRANPSSAVLFNDLGSAYGKSGAQREELEAYARAIQLKPEFAVAHFNMALARLRLGDYPAVQMEIQTLRTLDTSLADKILYLIKEK